MSAAPLKSTSAARYFPWRIYALGAAGCIALSVLAYMGGVRPAVARTAEQEALAGDLAARRRTVSELTSAANAAKGDLAATRKTLAALPLKLESAAQVNQRLAMLTDLAAAAELTVNEIRPGAVIDGTDFRSVPIQISGTGAYPACAAFLSRLHHQFPDTAVRSFHAGHSAAGDGAATFSFELFWHTTLELK